MAELIEAQDLTAASQQGWAIDYLIRREDGEELHVEVRCWNAARAAAERAGNAEARKRLYEKLRSLLPKLNMNEGHLFHRFAYMKNDIPVAGVAHQAGTCRMGADAATSVVNPDCRAHELDNLYVVDTSVFPSIGAVNPALTAPMLGNTLVSTT